MMMVEPSPEIATEKPAWAIPVAPDTVSFCCWVQLPFFWLKIHAAPAPPLSPGPPITAVLPSPESATEKPWCGLPWALRPTNFCCSVQLPLLRVKIHAAPLYWLVLSFAAPIRAVFPSADNATDQPTLPGATSSAGDSLLPCCVQTPLARV